MLSIIPLLLIINLFINRIDGSTTCTNRLIWNDKQYLEGFGGGFQLRVCCNISSVTMRQMDVDRKWTIDNRTSSISHRFGNIIDDADNGYRQLSICTDKSEPTIGYIESHSSAVNCTYPQLQLLTIRQTNQLSLNRWYVICYQSIDNCEYCHFEVICDNEYSTECMDIWMHSSVASITNTSMIISIRIGAHMPFVGSSDLRITINDAALNTRRMVIAPQSNRTMSVPVDELRPSHLYTVRVCLHISAPRHFLDRYQLTDSNQREMCQQAVYRTQIACELTPIRCHMIIALLIVVGRWWWLF